MLNLVQYLPIRESAEKFPVSHCSDSLAHPCTPPIATVRRHPKFSHPTCSANLPSQVFHPRSPRICRAPPNTSRRLCLPPSGPARLRSPLAKAAALPSPPRACAGPLLSAAFLFRFGHTQKTFRSMPALSLPSPLPHSKDFALSARSNIPA